MNSQDPTLLIILSEIALFEFVVIIAALVIFILKKRKKSRVLKTISEQVNEKSADREEFIKSSFMNIPSLAEDSLTSISREIVKEEVGFYQYIIDTLYVNDAQSIEGLNEALEKMVLPYTKLAADNGDSKVHDNTDAEAPAVPNVDDAIDDFLDDNNIEIDNDPEFDLSEQGEIAEIPDNLLDEEESTS